MKRKQKQYSVLIIEDNPRVTKIYKTKLQFEGFQTLVAPNGEEGLEKAKRNNPDLILLDVMLPGVSGFEVLKKLKDNPKTREIPVLILSNLAPAKEQEQGRKLGAVDYFVKTDVSIFQVVEKIKELIKSRN